MNRLLENSTSHNSVIRKSFLRFHVAQTLAAEEALRNDIERLNPLDDLLAMQALRASVKYAWEQQQGDPGPYDAVEQRSLPSELKSRLAQLTSPQHFFGYLRSEGQVRLLASPTIQEYGEDRSLELSGSIDKPGFRLYSPVPVRLFDAPSEMPVQFTDLSHLLAELGKNGNEESQRRSFGVFLRSRSGAGKTVACWRAWFDCIEVDSLATDDELPLLNGCVPCWIHAFGPDRLAQLSEHINSPLELLLLLLASTAGMLSERNPLITHFENGSIPQLLKRIRHYCAYGPRMLIFVDLNHFEPVVRREIARGLVEFQERHHAEQHACIVTYRSAIEDDSIVALLKKSRSFLEADLRPLTPGVASSYLRNYREYESALFRELAAEFPEIAPPERNVYEECHQLNRLIARTHTRGEPLISTPLLMHWAANLSTEQLRQTYNITHLYRYVVKQHIEREADDLALADLTHESLITAMTRLALVIQAGDQRVRISVNEAHNSLQNPEGDRDRQRTWWPTTEFWLRSDSNDKDSRSPYYFMPFSKSDSNSPENKPRRNQLERSLESGLLRRDGDQIGFVHDSLIPYFTGSVALREYLGPGNPGWDQEFSPDDRGQWFDEVYQRIINSDPEQWEQPVEFLAGALEVLPLHNESLAYDLYQLNKSAQAAIMLVGALALAPPSETTLRLTYHAARGASRIPAIDLLLRSLEERRTLLIRKPHLLLQVIVQFLTHVSQQPDTAKSAADTPDLHMYNQQLSRAEIRTTANTFLEVFLDLYRQLSDNHGSWLKLISGSRFPFIHPKHKLDTEVTAVLVASLPTSPDSEEDWVVVGLNNGKIHAWNPSTGTVVLVGQHAPKNTTITDVEIIRLQQESDGSLYSSDSRGGLRCWSSKGYGPQWKMQILIETGGELPNLHGFPQYRTVAVSSASEIATLDDDGQVQLLTGKDYFGVPHSDDTSEWNQHQKSLVAVPDGAFTTLGEHALRTIRPNAGVLEPFYEVDFRIKQVIAAHGSVAVWGGEKLSVWNQNNDTRHFFEFDDRLRSARPSQERLVIAVTTREVLLCGPNGERRVLYPANTNQESCSSSLIYCSWITDDLVLLGTGRTLVAVPLSPAAESGLSLISEARKHESGFVLFAQTGKQVETVKTLALVPEIGIVSVWANRWGDRVLRITELNTGKTKRKTIKNIPDDLSIFQPGPRGSLLIGDDNQLWQLFLINGSLVTVAQDDWYLKGTGYDKHGRIFISSREKLWRVPSTRRGAELLCDLEAHFDRAVSSIYVTGNGHVIIATDRQVFRWRPKKTEELVPAGSQACPLVSVVRPDGKQGQLNTQWACLKGSPQAICLATGVHSDEMLVGTVEGDIFRWQVDQTACRLVQCEFLNHFEGSIVELGCTSVWDILIVTRQQVQDKTDAQHQLLVTISSAGRTDLLWSGKEHVRILRCLDEGGVVAAIGDEYSSSKIIRWDRVKTDDGIEYRENCLLAGTDRQSQVQISHNDYGPIASIGNQWITFVDNNLPFVIRAISTSKPVIQLNQDPAGIVTFATGATSAQRIAHSHNALVEITDEGQKVLSAIPPVAFEVEYRDEPYTSESVIKKAVVNGNGNVALVTSNGHLYFYSNELGEIAELRSPELGDYGDPKFKSHWQIVIDEIGLVYDWSFMRDYEEWSLYRWNHKSKRSENIATITEKSFGESDTTISASQLLPQGDVLVATYEKRGEYYKYPNREFEIQPYWSTLYQLSADQCEIPQLIWEMEWPDPNKRLVILSIAEWGSNRILLGFENGRIGMLYLNQEEKYENGTKFTWLKRNHDVMHVQHLKVFNSKCFASAGYDQLQVGTVDEVLLEYESDLGISDLVLIKGDRPQIYLAEGDGTLLEIMGDTTPFIPD